MRPLPRHLAKRRLAEHGPSTDSTDEARGAALIVASELRLQGESQSAALTTIRGMPVHGCRPPARLVRQLERSVAFAYSTPSPILTGCCRDPREHTGSKATEEMRRTMAPYCDDECARTCPMLLSILNPHRALVGTPYESLDRSAIWLHGGGLSRAGHDTFQLVALLAVAQGAEEVFASGDYVCMKLQGTYTPQHIRKVLKRLHDAEIVTLLDKNTGLRRVHALSDEQVAALEHGLGVDGIRERNVAEARKHSDAYHDFLADVRASLSDLDDWNPPPESQDDEKPRKPPPRFLRSWGGLTGTE